MIVNKKAFTIKMDSKQFTKSIKGTIKFVKASQGGRILAGSGTEIVDSEGMKISLEDYKGSFNYNVEQYKQK